MHSSSSASKQAEKKGTSRVATSDCAEKKNQTTKRQIRILVSKRAEFSCYVVTVGCAHGQQLNVLQVDEVPVDTSPKGFFV